MSRVEFIQQLNRLLYDIPVYEREAAVQYYEDYFEEAGPENEGKVIQELGSPGRVAATIKADLKAEREKEEESYQEYTETGYQDARFDDREMPETRDAFENEKTREEWTQKKRTEPQKIKRKKNGLLWGIIIIAVILTAPALGGLAVGLLGTVAGLFIAFILLVGSLVIAGVSIFVAGIALIVRAVFMINSIGTALCLAGIGCLLSGIAILLCIAGNWIFKKVVPPVFRAIVDFIQRLLHRGIKGGEAS